MSDELHRAAALRNEFDLSFATAPSLDAGTATNLLAITVGGHPYAMRSSEVGALLVDRTIVPVPTNDSRFLGVIGYRGLVIPVFDLGAMLGYPPASTSRWVAVAGTTERPIGFAVEHFDGQFQIREGMTGPTADPSGRSSPHVAAALAHDGVARSILSVDSLLAALGAREQRDPEGAIK